MVNCEHGFHYPLQIGTRIVVGYLNGDQDRPVILGALPSTTMPSPVNLTNRDDHLIRTTSGNQLLMQDTLAHEQITLATNNSNLLNLNASADSQATLATNEGQINITAKQNLNQITQANYNQTIGGDHNITSNDHNLKVQQDTKLNIQNTTSTLVGNQAQLTAQTGDLTMNTAQDTTLHAEGQVNLKASHGITIQNTKGDMFIKADQAFNLKGKTIIYEVGLASLMMDPQGHTTLRGTSINAKYKKSNQQAKNSFLGGTPAKPQAAKVPVTPQMTKIGKIESGTSKKDIIEVAKEWQGTPYAFSDSSKPGEKPENYEYRGPNAKKGSKGAGDCSGTTHAIYKEAGYEYSYVNVEQFITSSGNHKFKEITLKEVQPGDVVTWHYGSKVNHMAIINSNGGDESNTYIWTTHTSGAKMYNNTNTIKIISNDLHKRSSLLEIKYWHYEGYKNGK